MSKKLVTKNARRARRQNRVRAVVIGTKDKPRLNVFRSLKHIFAQVIDDSAGVTLTSVHSNNLVDKKGDVGELKGKTAVAYLVGLEIAEKAKAKGITTVVFDRAGYRYHGRVASLAEGARKGGLIF